MRVPKVQLYGRRLLTARESTEGAIVWDMPQPARREGTPASKYIYIYMVDFRRPGVKKCKAKQKHSATGSYGRQVADGRRNAGEFRKIENSL